MTKSEKHANGSGESRDGVREDDRADNPSDNRDDPQEPEPQERQNSDDHRGRSTPLVWLAMLLALGSLGIASYPSWSSGQDPVSDEQPGPSASEFGRLVDRVDTIQRESVAGIDGLRGDLDRLAEQLEAEGSGPDASVLAERIDRLSARLEGLVGERNTALGSLRTQLEKLESEVGRRLEQFDLELSNVGTDLDRTDHDLSTRLLLMEIDSLFAIAQNHLVMSGDGSVSLQAWERAVERLTALNGAEFQELKDTARRELRQLQEYRPPDLGAQIERLFSMADSIAEWPVNTIQPAQSSEPGSNEDWRARLSRVAGSLVRVESVDQEFLAPNEIDLARGRVGSALQTAALAMVRSRPDLARRLIVEAADAAQSVFDTDDPNVSEALGWLAEFADSSGRVEPPELIESRAEISRLLGVMQ